MLVIFWSRNKKVLKIVKLTLTLSILTVNLSPIEKLTTNQ